MIWTITKMIAILVHALRCSNSARVGETIKLWVAVIGAHHVVLSNDVGGALGEVEGDTWLVAAKVVGMENELPAAYSQHQIRALAHRIQYCSLPQLSLSIVQNGLQGMLRHDRQVPSTKQ